jgi:uncharacterized protein
MAMDLERFELVLLRRAPDALALSEAEGERVQGEHLAFYQDLRNQGRVVTNGPVLDQPDENLRGLCFYRLGSLKAARALAETDPAVVAGRLTVEVMTWWCAPGTMVLPGQPITVDG